MSAQSTPRISSAIAESVRWYAWTYPSGNYSARPRRISYAALSRREWFAFGIDGVTRMTAKALAALREYDHAYAVSESGAWLANRTQLAAFCNRHGYVVSFNVERNRERLAAIMDQLHGEAATMNAHRLWTIKDDAKRDQARDNIRSSGSMSDRRARFEAAHDEARAENILRDMAPALVELEGSMAAAAERVTAHREHGHSFDAITCQACDLRAADAADAAVVWREWTPTGLMDRGGPEYISYTEDRKLYVRIRPTAHRIGWTVTVGYTDGDRLPIGLQAMPFDEARAYARRLALSWTHMPH